MFWLIMRFLKTVIPINPQTISKTRSTAVAKIPCLKPDPKDSDKKPTANSLDPMSLWSIGKRRTKADEVVKI